jgi:HK97 family phage portal protein
MFHWRRKKSHEQEAKSWTLAAPSEELLALFGALPGTASGITVSAESALRVPAVACAVRVIAEAVAQLPLITYQRGENGTKERATEHPAYALLHDDANEWQSAYDLKLQLQTDVLLNGNAYAFVNRVGGTVREIIRLNPAAVAVETDGTVPRYVLTEGKTKRIFSHDQIIHIRGLSTDGILGKSPVKLAAEAIGIAIAQERHAARLLGNGGRPSGVLKLAGKLSRDAVARIRAAWNSAHSGDSAGGTAVLEEDMSFEPLSFNSVDMQFLELNKFQIEQIARIFRVPPHLLMELGRATWSNSEEMGRVFLTYTLMPWLKQWEGALRRAVFTKDERQTFFSEFLVDDFQRADLAARAAAYSQLITARVINPNEARAMENRPPYDGGDEFINPNVQAASDTPSEEPQE